MGWDELGYLANASRAALFFNAEEFEVGSIVFVSQSCEIGFDSGNLRRGRRWRSLKVPNGPDGGALALKRGDARAAV